MTKLPLPPPDLAARVGTVDGRDPLDFYLDEGERLRGVIERLVPAGWTWDDKRVLDFGCGSARVLRHFGDEAERGVFRGCDIDPGSIEWDEANLSPPFRFFTNAPAPPLSLEDGSLDLVWAMSVFTHIADLWSDWLVEMHRVLAPGGILIASYLGEGMWQPLVGEPCREDEVGMSVLHHWEGADAWVFHSEWWLREHWGRAFDVLDVRRPPREPDGSPQVTHSYIALRRRDLPITKADLERIDPDEPRELAGLQTNLRLARREMGALAAGRGERAGTRSRARDAARRLVDAAKRRRH
ncbi:MAG TPA: class I SAM-dependent methyltransferase [Thermoleophilaceae bacterium]